MRAQRRRRAAGWTMIVVGVASAVVAIVGVFVGRSLLSNTEDSVDDSLLVTSEALTTVDATLALADDVLVTISDGVDTIAAATGEVGTSFDDVRVAVDGVSALTGGEIATSIETISDALPELGRAASTIEGLLDDLGRIPLAPDYDPAVRISEVLEDLEADLGPLPDELRTQSAAVQQATASIDDLDERLEAIETDLVALGVQLDRSQLLLDDYRATTARAITVAARTRDDLGSDIGAARTLVVLLGLLIAAGQLAPIWTGVELLRSVPPHTDERR